jgi:zinc/manganese transport system ATP-binding protein
MIMDYHQCHENSKCRGAKALAKIQCAPVVGNYPLCHGRVCRCWRVDIDRVGVGLVVRGWPASASRIFSARPAEPITPSSDIVLHELSLGYRDTVAISGLTGKFAHKSLTAVVGPNGGGKTTLLKGLLGLVRPIQGRIECPWPSRAMAYLSQANEVDRGFPVTVSDFVALGLWNRIGSLRAVKRPLKQCIDDAIAAVGLQGFEHAWISDLSGGQFQRVRFARLLLQDAPVVLLDEPFAGVDTPTVEILLQIVARWHSASKTVIAVLHDLEIARQHFPRTLVLANRALSWGETPESLAVLEASGRRKKPSALPVEARSR